MNEPPLRNINPRAAEDYDDPIMLQKNDPSLSTLFMAWDNHDDFIPHDDDWGRTGECIGRNTHLDTLFITGTQDAGLRNVSVEQLKLLCKGMSSNQTIKMLDVGCLDYEQMRNFMCALAHYGFFENDSKLETLAFGCCRLDPASVRFMTSRFPHKMYLSIALDDIEGGDKITGDIITSLFHDPGTVGSLSFSCSNIGNIGCNALAHVLQDPRCFLWMLDLSDNDIRDEGLAAIVTALARESCRLSELVLSKNQHITPVGWRVLFSLLRSGNGIDLWNCSLKKLSLCGVALNDDTVASLATSLCANCPLKKLDISNNPEVSEVGWQALSAALQKRDCMLEELVAQGFDLNETSLIALASSLAGNCRLQRLELSGNRGVVTAAGVRAFSQAFENANSALEKIQLSVPDDVVRETANDLAASLVHNKKLRELCFFYDITSSLTMDRVSEAFESVVCDKSSIASTYLSNHTLSSLGVMYGDIRRLSRSLESNLRMNSCWMNARKKDKKKVARRKIMKVHFNDGMSIRANLNQLLQVEWAVLPHAIAWLAAKGDHPRDNHLSLLYQFVREIPIVYGLEDKSRVCNAPRKRQRTSRDR